VLVQDLDRDGALQLTVEPAIDDRHPALADTLQQLVLVENLPNLDQRLLMFAAMTEMSGGAPKFTPTSRKPMKLSN
jgi:hypothetical protein